MKKAGLERNSKAKREFKSFPKIMIRRSASCMRAARVHPHSCSIRWRLSARK